MAPYVRYWLLLMLGLTASSSNAALDPSQLFQCHLSNAIYIWRMYTCDGAVHCPHGEDEEADVCAAEVQPAPHRFVPGGRVRCVGAAVEQYVRLLAFCDAFIDCMNGYDELHCGPVANKVGFPALSRPYVDNAQRWSLVIKQPLRRSGVLKHVEFYLSSGGGTGHFSVDLYRPASPAECNLTLVWKKVPTFLNNGYNKLPLHITVRAGDRIGFSWEYDIAIVFDQSATNTRPFDYCHGSVTNQRVGNTYVLDRHMGVTRTYSFQVTYDNIDEDYHHKDEACLLSFCTEPTNITQCTLFRHPLCEQVRMSKDDKDERCLRYHPSVLNYTGRIKMCELDRHCAEGYRCHNSDMCYGKSEVCNGVFNCPLGDDEHNCLRCPNECSCDHNEFNCTIDATTDRRHILNEELRALTITFSNISEITVSPLQKLLFLNLSHNALNGVPWHFGSPKNLRTLDLSYNNITVMTKEFLNKLDYLRELYLEGNNVQHVDALYVSLVKQFLLERSFLVRIPKTEKMCCELWGIVDDAACVAVTERTGCMVAKGLLHLSTLHSTAAVLGWMIFVLNIIHLLIEGVKKRQQHQNLRFVLVCNTPLVGMGYGLYNIAVALTADQHRQQEHWQQLWMDSLLCKAFLWFSFALHLANAAAILMATTYNYILTYVGIKHFKNAMRCCVLINSLTVLILPGALASLAVAHPALAHAYLHDWEELCHPLKLVLYAPPTLDPRPRGFVVAATLIGYVGVSLLVLLVVVSCFVFSCGKCMQEVIHDQAIQVDEDVDGAIAADFSCFYMFSLLFDFLTWLGVSWLCLTELLNPQAASWEQKMYLEVVLIYIPLSKLISPLMFLCVEVVRFIIAQRSLSHVKGNRNSLMLKYMLSPQGNRRYEKLATFLKKGGMLSPDELLGMFSDLSHAVLRLHMEGLVCDYINPDFVIICIDNKNYVKQTQLVATTEYPKWDVHEWRKCRDVAMLGEVIQRTMQHLTPAIAKRRPYTRGMSLKTLSIN